MGAKEWFPMIVLSFNIRGLGGRVKRRRVRELVRDHKVDFLALQETKMEVISESFCRNLWGSDHCEWAFFPSEGASGGILSIWGNSNSNLIFTFMGEGFVGVCLEWGVKKSICFIVNVYSKCELAAKKRLWRNISMCKGGFGSGAWCVVGDFNAVRRPEERRGVRESSQLNVEMREFDSFIEGLELNELPLLGRRFTWYHANGVAMSRIDRGLISSEWEDLLGPCSLWVWPRDISDHCPVMLKYGENDWGPKPFRFNNYWLENRNFNKVVEERWRSIEVNGWMAFVLKEKLRGLKARLKEWHIGEYGSLENRIKKVVEDIIELDVRGENVGLSIVEVSRRKELFVDFWKLQKIREATLFQRSRSKWLRFGDSNSKFFHGCVVARSKRNNMVALKVGEV
jgi:exonuclease III